MSAAMSMEPMVEQLMLGLGIKPAPSGGDVRFWRLDDNDVVRLAQVCVRQIGSLKADPEAAPLALQAAVTRNAWALVDASAQTALGGLPELCPFAETDPLSEIWHSALSSRIRWHQAGGIVQ